MLSDFLDIEGGLVKFFRFGDPGRERPGVLDLHGVPRDISSIVDDLKGSTLAPQRLAKLRQIDLSSLPAVAESPRLGPCVAGVGNFIAVGLNYADHAAESGAAKRVPISQVLVKPAAERTGR
jgi:2-keto-4-pentenoate hydratase/2-oxohepta-3-ene-1,7-dioic acid hydratase in catechol pathway